MLYSKVISTKLQIYSSSSKTTQSRQPNQDCLPYSRGIIFGGLAVFLSHRQYCANARRRRGNRTVTAKFISTNCNFLPFSSNLPNIIPANISGYTVFMGQISNVELLHGRRRESLGTRLTPYTYAICENIHPLTMDASMH